MSSAICGTSNQFGRKLICKQLPMSRLRLWHATILSLLHIVSTVNTRDIEIMFIALYICIANTNLIKRVWLRQHIWTMVYCVSPIVEWLIFCYASYSVVIFELCIMPCADFYQLESIAIMSFLHVSIENEHSNEDTTPRRKQSLTRKQKNWQNTQIFISSILIELSIQIFTYFALSMNWIIFRCINRTGIIYRFQLTI